MLKRRSAWFALGVALLLLTIACIFTYKEAYACQIEQKQWQDYCAWAKRFAVAIDWILEQKPDAWVAFFTLALFVSTTGLWIVTYRLWDDARNQRRDNRRAIFANLQAAKAARRSADLARDEFVASHRPEFVIHSIDLVSENVELASHVVENDQAVEPPLQVRFVLINAGTGTATIVSSAAYLAYWELTDAPWRSRPHLDADFIIDEKVFAPGKSRTLIVFGSVDSGEKFISDGSFGETSEKLLFFGWILYIDGRNNERTTYFCRIYDSKLNRFTLIEDPEANKTY